MLAFNQPVHCGLQFTVVQCTAVGLTTMLILIHLEKKILGANPYKPIKIMIANQPEWNEINQSNQPKWNEMKSIKQPKWNEINQSNQSTSMKWNEINQINQPLLINQDYWPLCHHRNKKKVLMMRKVNKCTAADGTTINHDHDNVIF